MSDFNPDLRPRLILHPPGADPIVLVIDPISPLGGTVQFPVIGSVPYTIDVGLPVSHVHLTLPIWGDVSIPVDPLGGGGGTVAIPGLGDVPYEIVLGPPAGVPESSLGSAWVLPALIIGGIILFMRRR